MELLMQRAKAPEAHLANKLAGLMPPPALTHLALWGACLAGLTLPVYAQPVASEVLQPRTAMPFYAAEQAVQGVYAHHLPALGKHFVQQANTLVQSTDGFCHTTQKMQPNPGQSPGSAPVTLPVLQAQWQHTMVAWEALSTPAVGPVVLRRSQRQIDFWPTRPELISKALAKAPQTLADMERVGTLAKGLPAMELLLAQWQPMAPGRVRGGDGRAPQPGKPMPAATCHYLSLLAQGIALEATELQAELDIWATKDWPDAPEATLAAMAEWVNQWLAGAERLRWAHLEKPIKANQTLGNAMKGKPVLFARIGHQANLAGWHAQWHSLLAQARLTPEQASSPPVPGQALVPIEALLLGKGQIALAQRWAQALDQVTVRMDKLKPTAGSHAADQRELLALAQSLKTVTVLFQNDIASALDIPLGFSDADGD